MADKSHHQRLLSRQFWVEGKVGVCMAAMLHVAEALVKRRRELPLHLAFVDLGADVQCDHQAGWWVGRLHAVDQARGVF